MNKSNATKIHYFDYAATTPLDPEVAAAMAPFFGEEYGNPSSLHARGRRAAAALEYARAQVADALGAHPEEIIFTGSGTESDNLALLGAARALAHRGRHVVVSAIEHKAVLQAAQALEREGFTVSYAAPDRQGVVWVETVLSMVRDDTVLVSLMWGNNEIGTLQPVAALVRALEERKRRNGGLPLLHSDACQAAGLVPLDMGKVPVDLLTVNGSKIYGPKGVGALYVRSGIPAPMPVVWGGGQERGLRGGTEAVPLIVGMGAALQKAVRLREREAVRLAALRALLIRGLQRAVPDMLINGHPTRVLPHIVHVTVPRIEGESMVLMLDEEGIEAATGSACSAHDLRPSHVLVALGHDADLIHGSVRFSLGRGTAEEDIARLLEVFPAVVRRLRGISSLTVRRRPAVRKKKAYAKEK